MTTNLRLLIITVVLAAASVWAYTDSVSRGDRFARGQKLLPNLNPDEVATIGIIDGEDAVTLQREGDQFTISENHGYPARNEAVNRFLRDLLNVGLEKEIGSGAGLAEELEIEPATDSTTEIVLSNATQQVMVRIRLGKSFEGGGGRYVQRIDLEDSPIYLTSEGANLSTRVDSFIKKEIVNHAQAQIVSITGPDFALFTPEEDKLELDAVPSGKKEKTFETGKLKSILSRLSFDQALLADDEAVRDLQFEPVLDVELDDQSGYVLALGTSEDKSYLRIRGKHDVVQVAIELDTPDEELKEKAALLTRADEIEDFNAFHDSWVYEISSFTADKLKLRKSDLIEDES